MNKTIIENTLKFLQRVDLKWNEVPAFVECKHFLELILDWKMEIVTKKEDIKQEKNKETIC